MSEQNLETAAGGGMISEAVAAIEHIYLELKSGIMCDK